MSTVVRPELSKKNPHYIEKHRYYELRHFCLQYPMWKKAWASLDSLSRRPADLELFRKSNQNSDPTVRCVEARDSFGRRMNMVEKCAEEAAPDLAPYILKYVTQGDGYTVLKMRDHIPCCKDVFYNSVHRFFWLLSKARD